MSLKAISVKKFFSLFEVVRTSREAAWSFTNKTAKIYGGLLTRNASVGGIDGRLENFVFKELVLEIRLSITFS